jgi:hypothetical protein
MASILVVLIILGCAVYQYFKGSLVKSLATLIIVVCGSVVAFGYFELLGGILVSRGADGLVPSLMPWAQLLSFVLLFVLTFAILQTAASWLISKDVDLGLWPERIGRVCCGMLLGLMLSGLLLTALAMGPLSHKYPYQRFDSTRPDVNRPNRVLLNADGFATGWFGLISRGGMSGKRSFASLHPGFLDQLYLNRHAGREVSNITSPKVIEVPREKAVWAGPEDLKDTEGRAVVPKTGCNLTIVRVEIKRDILKQKGGEFTLSQLRLICKQKDDAKEPFAGKGINVYPIGRLKSPELLEIKRLNDLIVVERDNFTSGRMFMDFAFEVPKDFVPVLVEFKQNNISEIPASVVTAGQSR